MSTTRYQQLHFFTKTHIYLLGFCLLLISCAQNTSLTTPTIHPTLTALRLETSTPLPDLVMRSIKMEDFTGDLCELDPTQLGVWIEINNSGQSSAGPFTIKVGDQEMRITPGLGAGETLDLRFPFLHEEMIGIVDLNAEIEESHEENNQLTTRIPYPVIPPNCFINPKTVTETIIPETTLSGHTGVIRSLDFSNNGNLLASGSIDNTMRLWQMTNKVLLRTMYGHPFPITAVEFTSDGNYLMTGSTDGLVRIWNVSDGRLLSTLEGHGGSITDVDISPDSIRFASSSDDFTVRIWRFQDGRLLQTIDEGMTAINDISFSPNGMYLAWVEENGKLRIWDVPNNTWFRILDGFESAQSLAFSPDGDMIAVGYSNGFIRLWQAETGTLIQELSGHQGGVTSLLYSPDGSWLISGSTDGTLQVWQQTGADQNMLSPKFSLVGHISPVTCIAIDRNNEIIASGSEDTTINLWVIPVSTPVPPN